PAAGLVKIAIRAEDQREQRHGAFSRDGSRPPHPIHERMEYRMWPWRCLICLLAFQEAAIADEARPQGLVEAWLFLGSPTGDFSDIDLQASPGLTVDGGVRLFSALDVTAGLRYVIVRDSDDSADYSYYDLHLALRPWIALAPAVRAFA